MPKRKPLPGGLCCPHPDCKLYGDVEHRRIIRFGHPGPHKTQLYHCKACGHTFSDTKGTFFYRLRTNRKKVVDALGMVVEKGGIRATGRATSFDKDTIQRWVERAGRHTEEVSAYLIRDRKLTEAQVDELWTFIKKKTSGSHPRTIPKKPVTSTSGGV